MPGQLLFSGAVTREGLTNGVELARVCPSQFVNGNPWVRYAWKFHEHGADTDEWRWKVKDPVTQGLQLSCLVGMLESSRVSLSARVAAAAWMLSEMLHEVPEHSHMTIRI